MKHRTQEAVRSLYLYLQDEPCNHQLDLSHYLACGWSEQELRRLVKLLRLLINESSLEPRQLDIFPSRWLQDIFKVLEIAEPKTEEKLSKKAMGYAMKALAEHGYIIEGIDSHQACLNVRKSGVSYQLTIQNAEDRQMKGLIILPL